MAIVRKYKAVVEEILNPLPDIYTVFFSSKKKFKYLSGQFLHLALDEYDGVGQWPESRCFSMQSNPDEVQLKITYVVKGTYTSRMVSELEIGKEVWIKLPYGDFFQRGHDKKNCVFIAGGTGVTPFLSLFTHTMFYDYIKPKIYLGFRSKKFNIYQKELDKSCNSNIIVKTYYEDEEGIINIEEIFNKNGFESNYFISGPPIMIKNFKKYLLNRGLDEEKIITDEWE